MTIEERIPVAVLGATGSVGQRFVSLLLRHPWFRLAEVTASERSAGRRYGEAAHWLQSEPLPDEVAALEVRPTDPTDVHLDSRLVFSALDSSAAERVEAAYAKAGHFVVSNAKTHRMDPDVPLLVPEVNSAHLGLLEHQSAHAPGALLTNPNCSTIGLVLTLAPLDAAFGIEQVHVVTMQAVSGAGLHGVPSMQMIDNLVPHIGGEEDKLETETQKILGVLRGDRIDPAAIRVSAQCTRVAVVDGHTLCVSVKLRESPGLDEVREALQGFRSAPQELGLPSAPDRPVHVLDQADRPQPRLDRDIDQGMAATVGRLRHCPLFDCKYVALSHNTLRGAAGGSILVAEQALAEGRIPGLEI
ncbi:MAG: aspartate-semialdehyde dehydrogenase [Thermoanaerobaculia bacterium]|nr:aspartate-semialdehyde dehydrogenase [Thermoanaerobaculia bacterium]